MKKFIVMLPLFACMMASAEFVTDMNKGWRLTIGPQFNFNASGRLGVKGGAIPVPTSSFFGTRAVAKAAGDAITVGAGRTTFPNGGFVDPNDSAGIAGETWNWRLPAGSLNGGVMSFANAYTERSSVYEVRGGSEKDDNWSVGANFGIERAVWKSGDFGVDVGFNFGFYLKDDWFKGSAGGYARTDSVTDGAYLTDVDMGNAAVLNDPWSMNDDGSYGGGTYAGPGPVINMNGISVSHAWGDETTRSSSSAYGPLSIRGDLQMYEFQLTLKPYYELTDWFMLRGTLGVGLDYRNFDVSVSGLGSDSSHDWDCYMLCGLGGLFYWDNICLGADFLRKVFDDELDVDTRYVNGSICNANWMFRVYIGYEF